ncbi:MAG: class I SAM-dependent RNA methyltransferase [Clostridia bacterium]|nr:class I SAM-dependent RNA methyltransferase [Clostridia bacterium]
MEEISNNKQLNLTITCASGVEKVTKSELKRLGFGENLPAVNGCIDFKGNLIDVARCNINLRTADRVYIKLKSFVATTFDQLFEEVKNIDFSSFMPQDANIVVNGKCVKSTLYAISACQSIIKKAICVSLSNSKDVEIIEKGEKYQIFFSIFKDEATIYLNTSGVGLHKRGYKEKVWIAPIKETLASSLLLMSDFYHETPFLDPFCGSGTIPIEACNIALNIAPNLNRDFDFLHWSWYDKNLFNLAKQEAKDKEQLNRKIEIFASDIDKKAIDLAKHHASRAGVINRINFNVCDVKDCVNTLKNGTIVTNPPYGERVYDKKDALECYKNLGELKNRLNNWSAFIITAEKSFEKAFKKKADRVRKLYNSEKECNFYYYYKERK